MAMQRVEITRPLRRLIRDARGGMTRQDAAAKTELSVIWWRQVENGPAEYATARTLARMCAAVGVAPARLRAIGHEHVADLVEAKADGASPQEDLEAHIMATPGLSDAQRWALVVMAQALSETRV
jgi:hypothetical protein